MTRDRLGELLFNAGIGTLFGSGLVIVSALLIHLDPLFYLPVAALWVAAIGAVLRR